MHLLREFFGWIRSIGVAFVFALLISVFVFQPTKVLGGSMEPTLQDKEIIYISKILHTLNSLPDYGDVVIIDSRIDRKRSILDDFTENPIFTLFGKKVEHNIWVKRVIGRPGDVLEFKNHKVYRNGQELAEPYIKELMHFSTDEKIKVPEGHIFVMGDNRNNSRDSRNIGSIPVDHVLGKMIM
ncbi:signal peptidase I [Effusibacillus lacus]|uniref:Signal peptidase I n=1 Tax=Effusibacillus lacus TaxID=1348429 RepID=A0A292YEE1_9BACL|nr:signal peptidase I [Effusibacillus lacus]TCS68984.1 signal peptidase I [Effusibacillus lacus]GAX91452.1 signal peptidase I [Effusibacillus lacus]